MSDLSKDLPREPIQLAALPSRKRLNFVIEPDAPARAAIAEALGLIGVRKLRFAGALGPLGKRDWKVDAELGATVQQACVVTLEPVTTRIDETVERRYLAEYDHPDAEEVELTQGDDADPMPETLDLAEVMIEALALALPPYPRADGAETGETVFTEPGEAPLRDEDLKPFAGLLDALQKKAENG